MTAAAAAAPAHHEPPPPTYLATKDSRSNTSADDLPPAKLEAGALSDEEYRRREKALVRKLDRNLIPFLTCVALLCLARTGVVAGREGVRPGLVVRACRPHSS